MTFTLTLPAAAQQSSATVYVPESSINRPEYAGKFAHTNYVVHTTGGALPKGTPAPPPGAETPYSLTCVYGLLTGPAGCPIAGPYTHHIINGWGAIALVDAYDNSTAAADLSTFATTYSLSTPDFTKVYVDTSHGYSGASCAHVPADTTGWALEEALDIEYSFAVANLAHIYLVEACSDSYADLMYAELAAGKLLNDGVLQGMPPVLVKGGDISNSWGGGEFPGETSLDTNFFENCLPGDMNCTSGYWDRIVYFASAGDSGCGAQWPSSSPWVVSAGGTAINRDGTGKLASQSCWSGSGGGVSSIETWGAAFPTGMGPWVNFQYAQFGQTARQTPDIAADADPYSGAAVYCTASYCMGIGGPWFQVGGTSLASPLLAGIVNIAKNKLGQAPHGGGFYTNEQNAFIYSELFTWTTEGAHVYDVKTGTNGCGAGAGPGWDQCTGVGTPAGYSAH
ncbi:MAG: hypothetical protein WCC92_17720 [Candidatus Korobacteraceae bacterium]